jgi:hypothetical protein
MTGLGRWVMTQMILKNLDLRIDTFYLIQEGVDGPVKPGHDAL